MNIGSLRSPFAGQSLGNVGMHSISQMMGNQGLVGPLGVGGSGGGSHQSLGAANLQPPQHHASVYCSTHNKEITFYCRTHNLPLCDACHHEHSYFDLPMQPVIAGSHYSIGGSHHDIVRIDKFLADTVTHM